MTVSGLSKLQHLCNAGGPPMPSGSTQYGAVDHPAGGAGGTLIRLRAGGYAIWAAGLLRTCNQRWARGVVVDRNSTEGETS